MAATLEQIDKLRERANVSYEEAKEAMSLCNDDFLSALIYLEKLGRVKDEGKQTPPPPPPPPWASQSQWTSGQQWTSQPHWAQKQNTSRDAHYGYSFNYPPYAYDSRARRFHEKIHHKAEKARRWAHGCDRRMEEAREAEFWKEFWYAIKKFLRLTIYGVCMVPIMFFATVAALFTKFTVKIERKDGKDVAFNGMLDKIAKFADDTTSHARSEAAQPKSEPCEAQSEDASSNHESPASDAQYYEKADSVTQSGEPDENVTETNE